jgi:peptidoglycan/xylan/chitin deacetylase (PgdA/CDA1 family)
MGSGKSRTGATRRAVLVVGGVTVLASIWRQPSGHPAVATQVGNVHVDAAHPHPAAHPARPAHPARRAHPARHAEPRKPPRPPRGPGRDEPGEIVYHVHDGRQGVALTIDDGPSPEYTPQVLRLLEKYKVAANPGLVREVAAAGHKIANHTWSHLDLAVLPPVTVADQVDRATGAIHAVTGREPALFRAPYGAWSPAVLEQCLRSGMTPLDWSVDPRDWSRPGVASIVANIMRNTRTGSIILEHDGGGNRSQTIAALKIVLPRLLDAGYHFTTP